MYKTKTDGALLNLLKGCTTPGDILQHPPFSSMIGEIEKVLKEETDASEPGRKPAADVSASSSGANAKAPGTVRLEDLVRDAPAAENKDELDDHLAAIEKRLKQFVKLIPATGSAVTLGDVLQGTAIATPPKANKFPVLLYDCKCAGEASAQPHSRMPPFQCAHLKQVLQGWVKAKENHEDELGVILVLDGMRPGLESNISQSFFKRHGWVNLLM